MSFEPIFNAFQNGQIGPLLAAAFFVFVIWFYREIRNTLIDVEKSNSEKVDKALSVYGELKAQMYIYEHENLNKALLIKELAIGYPFLPIDYINKIIKWEADDAEQSTSQLISELNEEILRIKVLQKDQICYKPDGFIISLLENFFIKIKISTFIIPFMFIMIAIPILLIFGLSVQSVSAKPSIDQFEMVARLITILINILLIDFIITIHINKRLNNGKTVVIVHVLMAIIAPLLIYWLNPMGIGRNYIGIIDAIISILYFLILLSRISRRSGILT